MNQKQKVEIMGQVADWLQKAGALYGLSFPEPAIRFDLTGSAAGQYRREKTPVIRFNAHIAAKQYSDFCNRTVPHEVAHLVVDQRYPRKKTRPHGSEWQQVMQDFGIDHNRCHDYDLTGIPVRRQERIMYQCKCRQHALTKTRHNRIRLHGASYYCRQCGGRLIPLAN